MRCVSGQREGKNAGEKEQQLWRKQELGQRGRGKGHLVGQEEEEQLGVQSRWGSCMREILPTGDQFGKRAGPEVFSSNPRESRTGTVFPQACSVGPL